MTEFSVWVSVTCALFSWIALVFMIYALKNHEKAMKEYIEFLQGQTK